MELSQTIKHENYAKQFLKNDSKRVLGIRIGAHSVAPGRDSTVMVIFVTHFSIGSSLK